jgi:DnaK suppressor protein
LEPDFSELLYLIKGYQIMTPAEQATLRSKIDESITATLTQLEELKELTKPISPNDAIGRISRMDAINNKTINDAALRRAEEKMKKLRFAQKRSEQNDFGICARCKNDIPAGRLLLMPESNRCVHCADR